MVDVSSRLQQHGLYAKLEKCVFETTSVEFLGFILTPGNIKMDPKKVSAILDWPVPTSVKTVQQFVGFSNFYRKFIHGFSKVIAPITQLTKKHVPFAWSPQAQHAFDELKQRFTSAPILVLPDPKKTFMEVDASETAAGAILSTKRRK
ncbi:uncharacterized protein WCC33_013411 [Rhinophrynus dorsalis]